MQERFRPDKAYDQRLDRFNVAFHTPAGNYKSAIMHKPG